MKHLLTLALVVGLAACSTTPQDPAQTLFVAEAGYAAALSLAVQYHNLPPCDGSSVVCSDPATLAQIRTADAAAKKAFSAAEAALNDPSTASSVVVQDIALAQAALASLQGVVSNLKVK